MKTSPERDVQGRGGRAVFAQLARCACAMAALLTAAPLLAQNSESGAGNGGAAGTLPTTATAVEVTESPTVDGRLDEAVWQQAGAMTDFTQREPFDGQPASERTEVRVLFDDDALYVGVWAFDSQADAITYGERIRDYEVNQSDAVVFVLDTYNDDQNGFVFGTTPTGIEYDGQVANEGRGGGRFQGGGFNSRRRFQSGSGGGFNKNWDGSWTVATTVDDEGWYAEFRIPFSTLRYGNDTRRWGFNVSRRVRRLNEESFWTPVPREFNLYRLNYAGDLEGLTPPFRRFATATPYLLGSTARDYTNPGEAGFGQNGDIGGEVKFQVTQGLTLDVTYNTDFAQVEVDDQQLNLTRFALNFPEKRPFFLENAGFFSVGGGGADLFFSRAIGIHQGQPVPIRGGARLSGRAAGLNVGLLHIETGGVSELGADAHGFSVVRLARELPNRSRVGGLFINKSGPAGDFNRTQAVDASVGVGQALALSGFAATTNGPGAGNNEYAWDVSGNLNTRTFVWTAQVREIGEGFNPQVGFLPRAGYRYYQSYVMYRIHPEWLREIRPHISYYTYQSRKSGVETGFQESGFLHIDSHWEWHSGAQIHTGINLVTEGIYQPFTIRGTDVTVPVGTYRGWESQLVFNSNPISRFSATSRINFGHFLSGSRAGGNGSLTWRPNPSFSTSARINYFNVNLPQGGFETVLLGMNFGYFFTPRIYVQSLVQYSNQVDSWSANLRFGWLNTAGTGLFIVYNDVQGLDYPAGLNHDGARFVQSGTLARSLIIKFTRQFNLLGR
ncbi:MAG: DUF5916 domain-containing protein [Gemmatimonadetes bacterium]|nr:DUF5916 domain-containing protein [Gemmatimonadota bacterium]